MKLLFIGDIVGKTGRKALKKFLPLLQSEYNPDVVIANGENAANGFGITAKIAREIFDLGVEVLTTGNHIWDKKDILEYIQNENRLIRPANYPENTPGRGSTVVMTGSEHKVAVLNLSGRIFMDPLDCPFKAADKDIELLREETNLIFIDFHAEATAEKIAAGWCFDGKVTALLGSHTHVQTADERILPNGTAYISDAGMTGSFDSVIGMDKDISIERFRTQMPVSYKVAKGNLVLNGVFVEACADSGKAIKIERVQLGE
jgi:metallophosphoesterase (TIGR00282 family)